MPGSFFAKENVYALDRATVSYQNAHHCHAASGCTENALFYQSGVRQDPDTRPLSEIARSAIFNAHPDGLCISANAAGQDVNDALIASVKQAAPEAAVLCNTGCRPDTIARKLP